MADSNPWSETPSYQIYVPPDKKSLQNRINFLIGNVKKKSKEINDIMVEIDSCNEELHKILTPSTFS